MPNFVNAGDCKLILPNDRGREIAVGEEVEVDADLVKDSKGVKTLIDSGVLVAASSKEAKGAGDDAPSGK